MTMKTKREIMRKIVETTLIKTATTDLEGRYHNGKGKIEFTSNSGRYLQRY